VWRTGSILVVDDEEMNLELMEAMLESIGHTSVAAVSAAECYDKLSNNIDLVLMDVMIPRRGFEAFQHIRTDNAYSDLPIIMVTSLSTKEDRLRAVDCGANDFISKPVEKTELKYA